MDCSPPGSSVHGISLLWVLVAVLGLFLVVASRGYSLVAVHRLLSVGSVVVSESLTSPASGPDDLRRYVSSTSVLNKPVLTLRK